MSTPHGTPEQLADLRSALQGAQYTVEHVEHLLGPVAAAALLREQPIPAREVLRASREPAAVLAALFVLGASVAERDLDDALPGLGARGLAEIGLIAPSSGDQTWVARCDLRPYGQDDHGWWVVSDLGELATGQPLRTDHVLGIGGASTTLASWTPRPTVESALDLGTGCGVQALHLARHATALVGTDISARALAYAAFNAGLNGIDLELRQGSLLEPVADRTFDLIVSNPPFVITPRSADMQRYEYRDGGAVGDSVVAELIGGISERLNPGGVAHLLGNWETTPEQSWQQRVEQWLAPTGLDAWVVQREVQDVAEYAETWTRDGGHRPGTPDFPRMFSLWMDDFASRGVDRIGFGIITLHQPSTTRAPWRHLEEVTSTVAQPMGPAVLAGLQARTWLAEHDDDALLETCWQVAPDVTEERVGRPGAEHPAVIQLRQGGGLGRVVRLETLTAGLVGACDGELTLGAIVHALATLTDHTPGHVLETVLPTVRELIAGGLLQTHL